MTIFLSCDRIPSGRAGAAPASCGLSDCMMGSQGGPRHDGRARHHLVAGRGAGSLGPAHRRWNLAHAGRSGAMRGRSSKRPTSRAPSSSTSTGSPIPRAASPTCSRAPRCSRPVWARSASAVTTGSWCTTCGEPSAPARVWWTFRAFGHERVAVLDGGLRAWRAEGRPLEQRRAASGRAALHRSPPAGAGAGPAAVRDNLATRREQVVDARSRGRFVGTEPEPRAGLRGGHIPGA